MPSPEPLRRTDAVADIWTTQPFGRRGKVRLCHNGDTVAEVVDAERAEALRQALNLNEHSPALLRRLERVHQDAERSREGLSAIDDGVVEFTPRRLKALAKLIVRAGGRVKNGAAG